MRAVFWISTTLMFGCLSLYAVAWYAAVFLDRPHALGTVLGSGVAAILFAVVSLLSFVSISRSEEI